MRLTELRCVVCDRTLPFEQPPCQDGHGPECDEWVCTACGSALLVASPTVRDDLRARRRRRVA